MVTLTSPLFTVRLVSDDSWPDLNVRVIGLSEDAAGTSGKSLLFQRSLTFDQQDRDLGMDTYDVTNEHQATAYGCVSSYKLHPPWLDLDFTEQGAEALGLTRQARLKLDVSDDAVETLRAGLSAVLCDVPDAGAE